MTERDLLIERVQNNIHLISREQRRSIAEIPKNNLTSFEYYVLKFLYSCGSPKTVSVIAQEMCVYPSLITATADKLHTKGLVERNRCEKDRRVVQIALTPLGRQQIDEIQPRIHAHLVEKFANVPTEDIEQLLKILKLVLRTEEE
ncbi:MarR family winged helix-turn-helix transcriptional regulator [Brevibacillus migulae]|uniref:MarR family winged helix-turn-helix transcriptional regulator n=1 Tax=Brevibacillus migulae TaxID=1644114 RepID=UPI00106EC5FE|nr:MarR family transcriptional regulator [Brevibacillus migulae]